MIKSKCISAALLGIVAIAGTAYGVELDSSEFDFKYQGIDIFDGENFVNDWGPGGDANDGELLDGVPLC